MVQRRQRVGEDAVKPRPQSVFEMGSCRKVLEMSHSVTGDGNQFGNREKTPVGLSKYWMNFVVEIFL